MKNLLKRNQVIIYVIAIMVMAAGYLNYSVNPDNKSVQTSMKLETKDDTQLADIGDATLVSSNDIVTENSEKLDNENTIAETEDNKSEIQETNTNTNIEKDDYFTKSKLERDSMYSQMIETYEKILNSNNTSETQKQSVTEEITKINNIKNSIMICENLLNTKGFDNSVIFVNGDSVSVIVGSEELKQEQVAQIQNIVSRELNVEITDIHIANK